MAKLWRPKRQRPISVNVTKVYQRGSNLVLNFDDRRGNYYQLELHPNIGEIGRIKLRIDDIMKGATDDQFRSW